ncbi:hypothetical protein pb186bvf_019424 [Paramecium bursaria]
MCLRIIKYINKINLSFDDSFKCDYFLTRLTNNNCRIQCVCQNRVAETLMN